MLFVATTGGHLAELFELADRIGGGRDRLWVTFDAVQSRSLLKGQRAAFIPYIGERDIAGTLRGLIRAMGIIQGSRFAAVVSTGSAIALSFLPYAASRGIPAHYVESAARMRDVSLTARLLEWIPGIRLYRQYPEAARGRWGYGGCVFDGFEAVDVGDREVRRVVVTVGSDRGFRRLIERAASIIPAGVEVLWQTGDTPTEDLGIDARRFVPAAELDQAMEEADVVVAHAGCGSALTALKAGKWPLLVPRAPEHGELIDAHQADLARWLSDRDLALQSTPEALSFDDLRAAAARRVVRSQDPPPFQLQS
jgi:UDP-N-acetylglucosamine transferase subunit ALG13